MNVDERDTRLGDVLDRAVRGIEASRRAGSRWCADGSRRRAGVLVDSRSPTVGGVPRPAVGFAATQVGRDAGSKPTTTEGCEHVLRARHPVDDAGARGLAGWSRTLRRWTSEHVSRTCDGPSSRTPIPGSPRSFPSFGGPFRGQAEDGDVAVMVDHYVGQGEARPTSLTFNAVHRIPGAEGWTSQDGKICSERGCARVYLVHGPDASQTDLDTATRVAEKGVIPERVAPSRTTLVPTIRYEDQNLEAGFSTARYQLDGWLPTIRSRTRSILRKSCRSGRMTSCPGAARDEGFDACDPGGARSAGS